MKQIFCYFFFLSSVFYLWLAMLFLIKVIQWLGNSYTHLLFKI